MKKVVKILTLVLVLFSIVFSNVGNMNVYAAEYPDNPDTLPIVHYVKNETSGLLYGTQLDPSYKLTSVNLATSSARNDVAAPSGKVMRVFHPVANIGQVPFSWYQYNLYSNTNYTVEYVVKKVGIGTDPVLRFSWSSGTFKQENLGPVYVTIRDTFKTKGNSSIQTSQVNAENAVTEDWRQSVRNQAMDLSFMSIKYIPNTPVIAVKDQTLTVNLSDVKGKTRADIVKIYEEQINALLNQSSIDTNNNNNLVLATVNTIPNSQTVIHSSADKFSVDILAKKWGVKKNGKLQIKIFNNLPAQQPEMNPIKETDKEITGKGTPGDKITVRDPAGKEIGKTTVDKDGNWKVTVPTGTKLTPREEITAKAKKPGREKESDPTEQIVKEKSTVRIDNASSLDFGKQKITTKDEQYKAKNDKNEMFRDVNHVLIKSNSDEGWSLQVKQNGQFKSESGKELKGAEIKFNTVTVDPLGDHIKTPSYVKTAFSLTPDGTGITEKIVVANQGEGNGELRLIFDSSSSQGRGIELYVPGNTTKYAEKYSTSLTWTLADVPTQE